MTQNDKINLIATVYNHDAALWLASRVGADDFDIVFTRLAKSAITDLQEEIEDSKAMIKKLYAVLEEEE